MERRFTLNFSHSFCEQIHAIKPPENEFLRLEAGEKSVKEHLLDQFDEGFN